MILFIFIACLWLFVFLWNKLLLRLAHHQILTIELLNQFLLIKLSAAEHFNLLKQLFLTYLVLSLFFFYIFSINAIFIIIWPIILLLIYIIWLRHKQIQKLEALDLDFPFFLNLLQSQLQTGMSIYQSIEKISLCLDQGPLKKMLEDFTHYSNTIPALDTVVKKINLFYPSKLVQTFCNIVIESIQYGTPIITSIQSFAKDVENQHFLYAEQQIQKIPVKLLAPLMICIFPVTFIIIFMPILISFLQQ